MQEFESRGHIEEALLALVEGLHPFVTTRFAEVAPDVSDWTEILARKDRQAGRNFDRYNPRDLSLLLRALTESFGALGYPFSGLIGRQANNCARELRSVRNKWAHNEDFTVAETYRSLDSAQILLQAIGADGAAERVAGPKAAALRAMSAEDGAYAPPTHDATAAFSRSADSDTPSAAPQSPPESSPAPAGAATIRVSALPVLSYAHARNAIPVVDEIVLDYRGPELRGASIEVEAICQLGSLGDPKVVIVDLDGTSPTTLRNADLRLDPSRTLAVDNPMPGTIRVTLRDADGSVITEHDNAVEVLAANQWISRPAQLSLELLTAYVQPNSAAIPPLLLEASDYLQRKTGNSNLDGYQQGSRERVDAIVEAIYESMRARDIRYAEPPASWGLVGQKVRTPSEVLEGRLGTCLDTTLTLAAALEEAGINSTLWLLDNHIFLGYWREEASLDGPGQSDSAEVVNYVGLGQIELVETTMVTGGSTSKPFADARREPHTAVLAAGLGRIVGVADVMQARLAHIYPLPSRTVSDAGDVVVREYAVAASPDALHYAPSAEAVGGGAARDLPARVGQWKNALLDLSLRNRLINYGEKAGYTLAVPQPALATLEDMINGGTALTLVPNDRIPTIDRERGSRFGSELPETVRAAMLTERKSAFVGVTEATYTSRLRALAYKARTIVEETGANNLYLAFGMLRWTFNDRELRSPLVLVPVLLEPSGRGQVFRLALDEAGESTPNYCLLEKLRVTFGLEIPGLANPAKDDAGIDLPAAFAATRQAIASARLPFTVEDTVDLSILQFAKYRLWKDLDENWKELSSNPLVSHLIHTPTAEFADPSPAPAGVDLDALGNAVPVAADSSQLEAVAEAVANRTFVLEGPPGTGKSQTITNVLAHALANGKRVLFVAEKRAALDVVRQRLNAVGLAPFSLDLHDKGARPTAVRTQIKAAIDAAARPDGAALKANTEAAATSRGTLRRYAERLHAPNAAGLSLYSARAQLLAAAEDVEPLTVPQGLVAAGTEEQLDAVRDALRRLPETADLAHPTPVHPWGFVNATGEVVLDTSAIHAAAQEFDAALSAVTARSAHPDLLSLTRTPAALERWGAIARAPRFSLDAVDAIHARTLSGEIPAIQQRLATIDTERPWFAMVSPDVLDSDVRSVHAKALAADASGFFGRRKRQRAALASFGPALRVDPKSYSARDVSKLSGEIEATADEVDALRHALGSLPLVTPPTQWNPYVGDRTQQIRTTLEWGIWLGGSLSATDTDGPLREGLRDYYRSSVADSTVSDEIIRLSRAWRMLVATAGIPEPTGDSPDALSIWAGSEDVFAAWRDTRSARNLDTVGPMTLDRWVAFVRALEPVRRQGMSAAYESLLTGRTPADIASLAFDKGIASASVSERAESQAMSAFDVPAHNRTIDRFTVSATAIREELPRCIPAEIIAKRRINPSYEGGMMGELKRQLARQRGGMSVRALFDNYGDLITQIAPCVLMSPESVARFFPAKAQMFDIVVFDEASQIRVADAVGAMGRGRAVVVVGDSKQMPPSSFAEVSSDIELESGSAADVVADEESILTECVQARVPRKWLSWHYRSQDESLISFSNHAYYDSRLSSFPAPWRHSDNVVEDDHGISLVRVSGKFNRSGKGRDLRTNAVEAVAIVDEVARRFAVSPNATPSLGIITFNAQQRTLIETLLREAPDERIARALDERDGLFVKNLENVQGDERDVILFSVAFSANERGAIPLNFGPLSRAGGERRLNVAITRARRQVILFASFDPSELRAEQTASIGIKHLKGYLELAASGREAESDSVQREQTIDRHRDEIANELRYRGYAVKTDVGLSDFRVDISIADATDPSQPLVAVLLDGEGWRARRTVADRDGLPVDVLKGLMQWPGVERVWLPEWLQQREQTLDRLLASVVNAAATLRRRRAAVEDAEEAASAAGPAARSAVASPALDANAGQVRQAPTPQVATTAARTEIRHPHLRQFVAWQPSRSGTTDSLDRLPSPAAAEKVRVVIRNVVQAEGPIHKIRLVKLVAESFGLSRVAAARSQAILRCLPAEYSRGGDRSCAWPAEIDPNGWREVRRSQPGDGRNFDHVPLEEIANAMAIVAELGAGMSEDEVKREALALFGGKRMTDGIASRLDLALKTGISSGRIERDARGLILPVV